MARPSKNEEGAAKARRALAVRMFESGHSSNDVRLALRVAATTVAAWRKSWKRTKDASTGTITPPPYRRGYLW